MHGLRFRTVASVIVVSLVAALSACGGGGSGSKGPHSDDVGSNSSGGDGSATNAVSYQFLPEAIQDDPAFLKKYKKGINHWDQDQIQNASDNCPIVTNPNQVAADTYYPELKKYGAACTVDLDGDGKADALDTDGDGFADEDTSSGRADNCPWVYNPLQTDTNGDGIGDACDDDLDGDGVKNEDDNCIFVWNPDQANGMTSQYEQLASLGDACVMDIDGDGVPDATDLDGDGVPDSYLAEEFATRYPSDNCPYIPNNPDGTVTGVSLEDIKQGDLDEDGIGDACDFFPDTPSDREEIDQMQSLYRGQKVCRFGVSLEDKCLTYDEYEQKRQSEQDANAREEGLGSYCPFGDGDEYKDARAFVGGEALFDVKWKNPGLDFTAHLRNPYAAVDEDFENYATFSLPLNVLNNLKELVHGAVNVVVNVYNFTLGRVIGKVPTWDSQYPTVIISKKGGTRFDEEYKRATVFLSGNRKLLSLGTEGGFLTLLDVDSEGNSVDVSDRGANVNPKVSVLYAVGGRKMYAISVPAKRAFNGVRITPSYDLVSSSTNIHGVCIE
ncbi:hypothetical protein Q668_10610 [Alcanivorax sp. PN-3]|jgi:thrombospondin type 3 repeat protein|nr:hypothetical protein Q668_10610 [Alcanivorax sp. PN-3]